MARWLAFPIVLLAAAGCVADAPPADDGLPDRPAERPTALFAGFHRIGDVPAFVAAVQAAAPGLVSPFAVGTSVEGRVQQGLRVTGPGGADDRVRFLVDGGIHGNEVYGSESALYLAAWLAHNHATNATVRRILDEVDVRIIFHINPDGREANARYNAHDVDLNRNFDVDFGNPSPLCRSQSISPELDYYAGPSPTSEPETRALADYMAAFEPQLYVTYHTGRHALIRPWAACEPPEAMSADDNTLFESIEAWARAHTTYQNTGTAAETAMRAYPPGAASGSSSDWCYLTYHCVAITAEVTEVYGEGEADPAEQAEEFFPVVVHLLTNARAYADWTIPPEAQAAYDAGFHLTEFPEHLKNSNPV